MNDTPPFPVEPIARLETFLANREEVTRRTGFIALAEDYAAQLAALKALRAQLAAASCQPADTLLAEHPGKRTPMKTDAEIFEAKRAAETFDALTNRPGIYQKIFEHVSEKGAYRIECDDGSGILNVCLGVDGDMHAAVWESPRARELGHFGGPAYRARTHAGGGRCERVRKALLLLALAIKADSPNR